MPITNAVRYRRSAADSVYGPAELISAQQFVDVTTPTGEIVREWIDSVSPSSNMYDPPIRIGYIGLPPATAPVTKGN